MFWQLFLHPLNSLFKLSKQWIWYWTWLVSYNKLLTEKKRDEVWRKFSKNPGERYLYRTANAATCTLIIFCAFRETVWQVHQLRQLILGRGGGGKEQFYGLSNTETELSCFFRVCMIHLPCSGLEFLLCGKFSQKGTGQKLWFLVLRRGAPFPSSCCFY